MIHETMLPTPLTRPQAPQARGAWQAKVLSCLVIFRITDLLFQPEYLMICTNVTSNSGCNQRRPSSVVVRGHYDVPDGDQAAGVENTGWYRALLKHKAMDISRNPVRGYFNQAY